MTAFTESPSDLGYPCARGGQTKMSILDWVRYSTLGIAVLGALITHL